MSTIEAKLQAEIGLPAARRPHCRPVLHCPRRTHGLPGHYEWTASIRRQRVLAFVGKLGAELHEQDGWNAARL